MVMKLADKKALVSDLNARSQASSSILVAHYRGLTVSQITKLRVAARERRVHIQVSRNTLARIAVRDTDFTGLQEHMKGPVMLFFAEDEPGSAAKLVKEFSKDLECLKVEAIGLSGVVYGPDRLDAVASLPTHDEAIAQVMAGMQSPLRSFAGAMQNVYGQLAAVLNAYAQQKS